MIVVPHTVVERPVAVAEIALARVAVEVAAARLLASSAGPARRGAVPQHLALALKCVSEQVVGAGAVIPSPLGTGESALINEHKVINTRVFSDDGAGVCGRHRRCAGVAVEVTADRLLAF